LAASKGASFRTLGVLAAIAVGIFAADQLSKLWVLDSLVPGDRHLVLGELLQLTLVRNPGAAFSLASGSTWVFSIIAATVVVVIIWFAGRIRSMAWASVFGLLLGGTLGNLFDRLFREPSFGQGHVIDFLEVWMFPAIFNVADIAIVSSLCLFVLLTIRGVHLDGRRSASLPTAADPEA